ncbi:hypothetical protein [Qipengyuania sp. RANM35]
MQWIRISGVILAVLGAMILAQIVDLPAIVGYIFLFIGALDVFIMPLLLARKWKSDK